MHVRSLNLLSPDAFSGFQNDQNALAASPLPRTPLEELTAPPRLTNWTKERDERERREG